jgi:2-aminoadipate transaminase
MFWKHSVSGQDNLNTLFQTTQFSIPPGFIDLGLGDPQFSLLPMDLLRRAAEERFNQNDPEFLQYGAEQGDGKFRLSLSEFLSRKYLYPIEPTSLFITNGASMGLHLICTLFTTPGDTIFVEEPTYFLALRIFADHELRLVPIRTDENGLVTGDLEEKLEKSKPKFLYIIPTYQNPTGHTLSPDRRKELLRLSRRHDFLLVADEVYHFLNYAGLTPIPFAANTDAGKVISVGSFSKILAPGLRLGWIQANEGIIKRFVTSGLLDSGGGMNPFTSAIVCKALENGSLDQNIVNLNGIYRSRVAVMDEMLRKYLPDGEFIMPQGGYFFWVHLPNGINGTELQHRAKAFKVGFRPGALFSSEGGMNDFMRISYVFYEPGELEQGIFRIHQSLHIMEH